MSSKPCAICGDPFASLCAQRKYCSDTCAKEAKRRQHRKYESVHSYGGVLAHRTVFHHPKTWHEIDELYEGRSYRQ